LNTILGPFQIPCSTVHKTNLNGPVPANKVVAPVLSSRVSPKKIAQCYWTESSIWVWDYLVHDSYKWIP